MKNKNKLIKKIIITVIGFIMIYCIAGVAAVVSDNDGSAFITKAEFDSLKNTFQSQIDEYNNGIDSKIDSAIASYLAGINIATSEKATSLLNSCGKSFVRTWKASKDLALGDFVNGSFWIGLNIQVVHSFWSGTAWINVNDQARWNVQSGTTNMYGEVLDYGTTKDYLLRCTKSTYDNTKYNLDAVVQSIPWASLNINKFTNGDGNNANDGTETCSGHTNVFDKVTNGKTRTTTGSDLLSYGANTWMVGGAGSTKPAGGYKQWMFIDTIISTESCVNCVAGGAVDMSNFTGYLKDYEQMLGNESTNVTGTGGWRNIIHNNSLDISSSFDENYCKTYYVKSYHHKVLTDITTDKVIDDTISRLMTKNVYLYNGLPFFKTTMDGKVTLKLTVTNAKFNSTTDVSKTKCLFALKNEPFTNAVPTGGWNGTGDIGLEIKDGSGNKVNDNKLGVGTYTITFKTNKGTTYWIKGYPDSAAASFKFVTTGDITINSDQ